jgi:hypothetical protein
MNHDFDSSAYDVDAAMELVCILPGNARPERRTEIQSLLENRTAYACQPDGVELKFDPTAETAQALLQFILFERFCCRTLKFELVFEPPQREIALRLRAPAKQVAALQGLYQNLIGGEPSCE